MNFKLGMNHQGLMVYKVYINDDPGLILNYLKAWSKLLIVLMPEAYARPRCQVSVYRTNGPLVFISTEILLHPFYLKF